MGNEFTSLRNVHVLSQQPIPSAKEEKPLETEENEICDISMGQLETFTRHTLWALLLWLSRNLESISMEQLLFYCRRQDPMIRLDFIVQAESILNASGLSLYNKADLFSPLELAKIFKPVYFVDTEKIDADMNTSNDQEYDDLDFIRENQ